MQDRFKFRFWDIEESVMLPWDCICQTAFNCTRQEGNEIQKYGLMYRAFTTPLKYTPLQCTGLKDKNGKLIYEGDVVTYEWLTPLGKVWRNDGKYIVEWSDGFCLLSNIARYDVEHGTKRNVEIIGNIYENPELLESEVE